MGELINSTYVSLDGVIETPETWPDTGGFGPDGNRLQTETVLSCSAMVMGRRTYDSFAAVWPNLPSGPLVDKMNAMPKFVASRTLTDPAWNNTRVVESDPVAAVRELKAEYADDLVQFGFGEVSHALLAAGLLDRLRLWVHPFVIGHGGPSELLYRDAPLTEFGLEAVTTLESGIVVLDYRVRVSEASE